MRSTEVRSEHGLPMPPAHGDRLLVFAPHPDDETLATGQLIRTGVAAGAAVRVVYATDGDNNPWPQRWIERRLVIGPAARRRWGARRRGEALAALRHLGVAETNVRTLGWHDQELTARLMADDAAVAVLAAEVREFDPTHVALPSLDDRHPDHSALHILLELALERLHHGCACLAYTVHGRRNPHGPRLVLDDPVAMRVKQAALACHETQMRLGGRRFSAVAAEPESFEVARCGTDAIEAGGSGAAVLDWPLPRLRRLYADHAILIVAVCDGEFLRFRLPLARLARTRDAAAVAAGLAGRLRVQSAAGVVSLACERYPGHALAGYAKLDRGWPRVVVFDRTGWQRFGELPIAMRTPAYPAALDPRHAKA